MNHQVASGPTSINIQISFKQLSFILILLTVSCGKFRTIFVKISTNFSHAEAGQATVGKRVSLSSYPVDVFPTIERHSNSPPQIYEGG